MYNNTCLKKQDCKDRLSLMKNCLIYKVRRTDRPSRPSVPVKRHHLSHREGQWASGAVCLETPAPASGGRSPLSSGISHSMAVDGPHQAVCHSSLVRDPGLTHAPCALGNDWQSGFETHAQLVRKRLGAGYQSGFMRSSLISLHTQTCALPNK